MPGLDTGRFPVPPASEFVCQICYDILCDPVIVPECEHVFCSDCLTDWLSRAPVNSQSPPPPASSQRLPPAQSPDENGNSRQYSNSATDAPKLVKLSGHCPIDRTAVRIDELRPPQRVFRNLLSALLIRCQFAPACDLSVPICELDYHEANCPHNPDNANREIECPKKCGANVRLTIASEHNCVEYLRERLDRSEKQCAEQSAEIVELMQEKQSLIETIQNDTNRYESTIQKLRSDLEKRKKSYEKEIAKLRAISSSSSSSNSYSPSNGNPSSSNGNNYTAQLSKKVGSGTNSLSLPNNKQTQAMIQSLSNPITASTSTQSTNLVQRKTSLDDQLIQVSDAFSFETMPAELPPPLTPSKVATPTAHPSDSSLISSKHYSESIPNLSIRSEQSTSSEPSEPSSPTPNKPHGVVRNAMKMLTKLPNMIPYVDPPSQLIPSPAAQLTSLDLTDHIRRLCRNEKVVQVMSLVDRRHFFPSNEYYKCLSLKHGAHSFKLTHELKLLELIEPLINGDSRILDIGSGHGFLTVCLAQIAKYVLGVEHIKDLYSKSKEIVAKNYAHLQESNRIDFVRQDGRHKCWNTRFDLILVEPIIKHEIPTAYLRSLRPRGCIVAVIKTNSKLQLCRVTLDSSDRPVTHILNADHDHLTQQYKDTLCDIRNQETTFLNRFKQF